MTVRDSPLEQPHEPGAHTLVPAAEADDRDIQDTARIDWYVPNFQHSGFGNRGVLGISNIRGLKSNFAVGGSPVVVYIDGVPSADLLSFDHELHGADSIAVYRGPQGHRFGKNGPAGVIDITTIPPGQTPQGRLSINGGSFHHWNVDGTASGPLLDDALFLGVSGRLGGREGIVHSAFSGDDLGAESTKSGRATLRWTPDNALDVRFTASAEHFDDNGGYLIVPIDKTTYVANTLPMFYSLLGRPAPAPDLEPFESYVDFTGGSEVTATSQSLRVMYKGQAATLTSITSRRDRDLQYAFDSDVTSLDWSRFILDDDIEQVSQELRIESLPGASPVRFSGGAFLERHRLDLDRTDRYGNDFFLVPMGILPPNTDETVTGRLEELTLAGYGRVTWSLPGNRMELTGGLRYEQVHASIDREHFFVIGGAKTDLQTGFPMVYGMPTTFDGTVDESETFSQWQPMAALDIRLNSNHYLHLSATRGFRPGGFNSIDDNPATAEFSPEKTWTYEAGLSGQAFEKRLTWNLTAFYIDVTDYQDLIIYNPVQVAFQNVPHADIRGLELEAGLTPYSGFLIQGTLGYVDPHYGDYRDPETGEDYSGNTIVLTPEYDYSLLARWRHESGPFVQLEMLGAGTAYVDQANTNRLSSYRTFNAKIGFETEDFDIYAYGRNLTDEEYFTFAIGNEGVVGEPRILGVEVNVRF